MTDPAGLEAPEVAGWGDVASAAAALAADWRAGALHLPGATCLGVGSVPDSRLLNHALGLGDAAALAAADGLYAALGIRYWAALRPGAERGGLAEALAERGFAADGAWTKFARGTAPPGPVDTDLQVAEAGPATAGAFGAICCEAFGLPPGLAPWLAALPARPGWSCFVALDGDEPVAAGALHAAGAGAWLAMGATRPSHRGRGAQPALIAARLRRAADLGCTLVVTETGAAGPGGPGPSYRNLLDAGFTEAWERPNLRSPEVR